MLLLGLLALAAAPAAGPRFDLASYIAVAARYATAENRAALREIRAWPLLAIADAAADLRRQGIRLTSVPGSPGDVDFHTVEAAVLLHAEAGLVALQALNPAEADAHLATSVALLEWSRDAATKQRRRGVPIVERIERRDFDLALAEATLSIGFPAVARPFAERARHSSPLDPEVHLVLGCVLEGLADEQLRQRAQAAAADWCDKAEGALRAALALDPSRLEARLRLGKLHLDRGRLIEAQPLLEEVEARTDDARQRYLARLFLGKVADERRRSDDAARFYGLALEAWPDSQAARFALARAVERSAGPAAARPLVAASLAASRRLDRLADPWWSVIDPRLATAALDRLWKEVLGQ